MSQTHAIRSRRFATLFDQMVADICRAKADAPLARMAIVVPSTSLRTWVIHRLKRTLETQQHSMLLGLDVITLQGLAQRIAPATCPKPVHSEVHRLLLSQRSLPEHLHYIEDPEGLLLAIFRDLADAGFEAHHMEAVEERLSPTPWWPTGQALLKAYVEWRRDAVDHNLLRHSDIVQEATNTVLAGDPLPDEALFWYGIYDLTGIMADFVAACCRRVPGTLYFPDFEHEGVLSSVPQTPDEYLRDVFDSVIQPAVDSVIQVPTQAEEPHLTLFNASGVEAEYEEVARRISAWAVAQDGEPSWTDVAVIARDLSEQQAVAEEVFRRYGIPVSLCRTTDSRNHGLTRQLLAIVDAIEGQLRPRLLFEALQFGDGDAEIWASHLGWIQANIREQGVTTLDDWERWATRWPDGFPADVPYRIPPPVFREFHTRIHTLLHSVREWPTTGGIETHLNQFNALIRTLIPTAADNALVAIGEALSATPVPVSRGHFLASVRRCLEAGFEKTIANHGVWLLDVMAARGMSFDHVYLVGINRHQWPRIIRDDPLFPDSIRRQLRTDLGLHALPVKERGHAEEALLFRHATQAAKTSLTVSYLRANEEGKPLTASPFVDEIRRRCPDVQSIPRRKTDVLRPWIAQESVAGIPLTDLSYWLAVQHKDQEHDLLQTLSTEPPRRRLVQDGLAASIARNSVTPTLTEFDGLVASRTPATQSLADPLHPTVLERFLQCPWRVFVERVLGIQASTEPDEIPVHDKRQMGALVHTVHEETVRWMHEQERLGESIQLEALAQKAHAVAQRVLDQNCQSYAGDPDLLRILIRPMLDELINTLVSRLGQFIQSVPPRSPGAVERRLRGTLELDDGRRVAIAARVDRLDQWTEDGTTRTRAVDLKTGSRPKHSSRAPFSEDHLVALVGKGQLLQSAFYHWLVADPPLDSAGYEYLDAQLSTIEWSREGWNAQKAIAQSVVSTGLDLMNQGAFVLRRDHHCQWCDVSATCARQHRPSTKRLELLQETDPQTLNPSDRSVERYQLMMDRGAGALDDGGES